MRYTKHVIFILLHIAALVSVVVAFLPMADWYFQNPTLPPSKENIQANPLWGVDFYYTASLVNLVSQNFIPPHMGWGYSWFSGWPVLSSYPVLHYYIIAIFTNFFDLIAAVKIWMLVSLALFFIGCYATFFILSRNIGLSIVLAVAGIYSVGVYGTLMWGGSLPSHATQAFFPWVLFFLILYLKGHNRRNLFIAGILAGLATLGHPQIVIAYIYPFSGILFIFAFGWMKFVKRILSLIVFLAISFLIGLPLTYPSIGGAMNSLVVTDINNVATSTVRAPNDTEKAIAAFHQKQPLRIVEDTNPTIFILLGVSFILFVVFLVFKNRGKRIFEVFPFIVLLLFSIGYVWMFAYGISIYHGGWYRLFWAVPFWAGMLIASCWGAWQLQAEAFIKKRSILIPFYIFVNALVLIGGYALIQANSTDVKEKIIPRSNTSSAYPNILNLQTSDKERKELKKKLIPNWMGGEDKQYRMYSGDQTISIWWNSLYSMPLARGYFDPPVTAQNRGYFFLIDASLSQSTKGKGEDQLAGEFHYPPDAALSNTLYFVDWYSIKYIESGPSLAAFTPLPKSFNTPDFIKRDEKLQFNDAKYNTGDMSLHYYEVKDEFTSPILSGTNAKTIGIIATDQGYETIIRGMGDMRLSSKQVIPVKLGQYIDKLNSNDLLAMDALIVYDYNYSNKGNAFKLLETYLEKGKKIFVDTGVEVKEANSSELPAIFPMNRAERKPLGKEWVFEAFDSELLKDVDVTAFEPPIFNNEAWSISYPIDSSDLRDETVIHLKDKGKPVIVSHQVLGGEVIWSGMNLPYHAIRTHNSFEIQFLKNIFNTLLTETEIPEASKFEAQFINPQKREITVQNARGVLFREQAYDGWSANVNGSGAKIYKVGPAYPGFMYVRIPDDKVGSEAKVTFGYGGSAVAWFYSILAFLIIVFLLEEILLGGRILGRLRRVGYKKAHTRVRSWWGKEDE